MLTRPDAGFALIALPQLEILNGIRVLKAQDRNDLMFFAIVDVINLKSFLLGATEEEVRAVRIVPRGRSTRLTVLASLGQVLLLHPGADCGRGVQRPDAEPALV